MKAIFDQLMLFGIEPFKARRTENCEEENETEDEESATIHSLLHLLSGFLDSEVRKFALV